MNQRGNNFNKKKMVIVGARWYDSQEIGKVRQ